MNKAFLLVFGLLFSVISVQAQPSQIEEKEEIKPPSIGREFRAAWIATVANINWPSSRDLSTDEQKEEALELLDLLQKHNYNAVIFQARPQSDALYSSEMEPWSYYLTGEQGKAPEPFYDPLKFWIDEAHKRNMELHVWMNPYRAHHTAGGEITEHSVVNKMEEVVVELETGFYWFDPSDLRTQNHLHNVVMDIVKRYDIDGVHFDDYFYPYPSYNNDKDFPDDKNWALYQKNGGELSRADWRREAVNTFVERIYNSIKEEKPFVKFGISPFGIWRPGYPSSITGMDQYEILYADAKKWLNEGWVDYFSPQLYWPINRIEQSFPVLLGWWNSQNHKNRNLWPGINIGLFSDEQQANEVMSQILITRGMLSDAPGTIHWNTNPLKLNEALRDSLSRAIYKKKALVPPMNEYNKMIPEKPKVSFSLDDSHNLVSIILDENKEDISSWIVYTKYESDFDFIIKDRTTLVEQIPFFVLDESKTSGPFNMETVSTLEEVRITIIDRYGVESEPFIYEF